MTNKAPEIRMFTGVNVPAPVVVQEVKTEEPVKEEVVVKPKKKAKE